MQNRKKVTLVALFVWTVILCFCYVQGLSEPESEPRGEAEQRFRGQCCRRRGRYRSPCGYCPSFTRCVLMPRICPGGNSPCRKQPTCVKIDCLSAPDAGTGDGQYKAWFFKYRGTAANTETDSDDDDDDDDDDSCETRRPNGQCKRFSYSGQGGNLNLYLSRAECQRTCFCRRWFPG